MLTQFSQEKARAPILRMFSGILVLYLKNYGFMVPYIKVRQDGQRSSEEMSQRDVLTGTELKNYSEAGRWWHTP